MVAKDSAWSGRVGKLVLHKLRNTRSLTRGKEGKEDKLLVDHVALVKKVPDFSNIKLEVACFVNLG